MCCTAPVNIFIALSLRQRVSSSGTQMVREIIKQFEKERNTSSTQISNVSTPLLSASLREGSQGVRFICEPLSRWSDDSHCIKILWLAQWIDVFTSRSPGSWPNSKPIEGSGKIPTDFIGLWIWPSMTTSKTFSDSRSICTRHHSAPLVHSLLVWTAGRTRRNMHIDTWDSPQPVQTWHCRSKPVLKRAFVQYILFLFILLTWNRYTVPLFIPAVRPMKRVNNVKIFLCSG